MNNKNSFKQRVLNAGIWSLSGNLTTQIIRFATNLIMTRLLVPEAYGLMAIAQVIIMGLYLFTDFGFNQNLVQNKRSDASFVNTVWTIKVIHGCFIWIMSILASLSLMQLNMLNVFPVTSVYVDPVLPLLIITIGFSSVISGFESTKMILGIRNLSIKTNIFIKIFSQLCGLVGMIIFAYYQHSVWALVLGHLLASTIQSACSHVLIKGERNQFCWSKSVIKEIFHFGKWIFFCSIAAYIYSASDRLLMGGLVDSATLGYYAIATLLATAIKDLITSMIINVGFPALSEAYREKPESLKSVFYKLRIPIDTTSMLLVGFLFATSTTIVGLLYDKRYESTGWMLQVISLSFLELRYKLSGECYMAIGKPKLIMHLILLDIAILYILGYFGFQWFGIKGLIWVFACSSLATIPLNLFYMKKFGILDWKLEFLALPLIPVGYLLGLGFVEAFTIFNNLAVT